MPIQIETIATLRDAPSGSAAVHLYSTGAEGGSGLTIGQLAIAVSMRSAAAFEAQGVVKMNRMASGSQTLEAAAVHMAGVADGTGDWPTIREFCQNELGITENLPAEIDTYEKRMNVVSAMKAKVDALAQSQQEDMIDLQTLVNRRDTAYSASSNIVRAFGTSMAKDVNNLVSP